MAKSRTTSLTQNPELDPVAIKQKFKLCKQRDKTRGAFTLKRTLAECDVVKIEKRLGGALPEDYRFFITNVGNFGAGPFEPLPGLIKELQIPDGHLAADFPHTKAWNMPPAYFASMPEIDEENEEESHERYWEYRMQYFDHANVPGAIPIGDEGCARYLWLVATGPQRDTLWLDERTDDSGFLPVQILPDASVGALETWYVGDESRGRSKRVGFAVLFNWWLDRHLKRLRIKWPQ